MSLQQQHQLMLYLKALIWSVYVSYGKDTTGDIIRAVENNAVPNDHPAFASSHLGTCLKFILKNTADDASRKHLADSLRRVQNSDASMIYQNMVFEIGHYVTSKEAIGRIPDACPGVVYHIKQHKIDVLFRLADRTFLPQSVYPDQVMPIYTLTIPDPSA